MKLESNEFFEVIQRAKDSGNDIITMSTKAWYNFLLQDEIMSRDHNQVLVFSPCRTEQNFPDKNWSDIWLRSRLKALSSNATSFCFKMLHDLLPTEYRLSTMLRNVPPTCKFSCQGEVPADLQHCLLTCKLVQDVGRWLLSVIELQLESKPASLDVISLNLDLSDGAVWVVINTLLFCWNQRKMGKRATVEECHACLVADLKILRETKHQNTAVLALEIMTAIS